MTEEDVVFVNRLLSERDNARAQGDVLARALFDLLTSSPALLPPSVHEDLKKKLCNYVKCDGPALPLFKIA